MIDHCRPRASALLQAVDFLSIGSNDLAQFLFAADRGNPLTGDRYDPVSPAFLKVLGQIAAAGREAGVPVTIETVIGMASASSAKTVRQAAPNRPRTAQPMP